MPPDILIVIVNFRTATLVADCLCSLEPEVAAVSGVRVIVVDGNSGDGSAEQLGRLLRERGYDWAELLPLSVNRGFAYANNAAIRSALAGPGRPSYVYLLNPDTRVHAGVLRELIAFMRAHPRVGIAGSRCENGDGSARHSAFRFHSILGELEGEAALGPLSHVLKHVAVAPAIRDEAHETGWVSGAAMLVRSEVFDRIGLLDDGFFLYFEETDFALRAARAGFECWYVPASRVIHLCGQSTGITGAGSLAKRVPRYWYDSRKRYFAKHRGRAYGAAADAAWLVGALARRGKRLLQRRPIDAPPQQLADFVRYGALHW